MSSTPTTTTPTYSIKHNPDVDVVPYTREEKSTIDAKFAEGKNYFKTCKNIYQAC
jgi:hypothetical protein